MELHCVHAFVFVCFVWDLFHNYEYEVLPYWVITVDFRPLNVEELKFLAEVLQALILECFEMYHTHLERGLKPVVSKLVYSPILF